MATEMPHRANATYHAIRHTAAWATFLAAMKAEALDPADERERRDAQRERETTYARGEPGGS